RMDKIFRVTTGMLLSFLCHVSLAQFTPAIIPKAFKENEFMIGEDTIVYRQFTPEGQDKNQKLPLIIALHGAENIGGRDGFLQFAGYGALGWLTPDIQEKNPCYVVAPHLYNSLQRKSGYDNWSDENSVIMLDELIKKLLNIENIDPNRIYLTGHSFGGIGTFMAPKYLKHFAALAPMNSAGGCQLVCPEIDKGIYNNMSIWAVHHRSDTGNSEIRNIFEKLNTSGLETYATHTSGDKINNLSENAIENLINQHQRYFYTEYNYSCKGDRFFCHTSSMDSILRDELFQKWIFKQYKVDPEAIQITAITPNHKRINWKAKYAGNKIEIWFKADEETSWELLDTTTSDAKAYDLTVGLNENEVSTNSQIKLVVINNEGFVYGEDRAFFPIKSTFEIPADFKNNEITIGTDVIPYRLFTPQNQNDGEKLPLVVALHGLENFVSSKENFLRAAGKYALGWLSPAIQKDYPCYVVAPHIYDDLSTNKNEKYGDWVTDGALSLVEQLINKLLKEENIDLNRIYLTGHSMGGVGSLVVPTFLKNRFAALIPFNSAGVVGALEAIDNNVYDHLPIWTFHMRGGGVDEDIRSFYNKLEASGFETHATHFFGNESINLSKKEIETLIDRHQRYLYTEYSFPCGGTIETDCHIITKDTAFADPLFPKWVFKQYKQDPTALKSVSINANNELTWGAKNTGDRIEIWFKSFNTWRLLGTSISEKGTYDLSAEVADTEITQSSEVKVIIFNSEGFAYAEERTFFPEELINAIPKEFKTFEIEVGNDVIPYRLFTPPNQNDGEKLPLVVALHGALNFASDQENFLRLANKYALGWLNPSIQEEHPSYVVAPHIYNSLWTREEYQNWETSGSLVLIEKLIDKLLEEENIDPNRIYLTGHSMGGIGSLVMPSLLKDRFAALIPFNSAGVDDAPLEAIEQGVYDAIPIWAFHHRDDTADEAVRSFYSKLEAEGFETYATHSFGNEIIDLPKSEIEALIDQHQRYLYTEYYFPCDIRLGISCHESAKDTAFVDPLLPKWVFKQYKQDLEAIKITSIDEEDNYAVNWEAKHNEDSVEVWFKTDEASSWRMLDKTTSNVSTYKLTDKLANTEIKIGSQVKLVAINEKGFVYGITQKEIDKLVTSLPNNDSFGKIKLFPNPTTDYVNLELPKALQKEKWIFKLFSLSGGQIKKGIVEKNTIDLTDVNAGIYIVLLSSKGHLYRTKLIKSYAAIQR
ncbi:MAG: PHB depolymerase family esterase, partial [Bacteroidota bacterium]